MKNIQHYNKKDSFMEWRIRNIKCYGNIYWLQLNYNPETSDILSVILEKRPPYINIKIEKLKEILTKNNIKYFILDFNVLNFNDVLNLDRKIGLILKDKLNKENAKFIDSYWKYRLQTRPQNCLTADVDSLEIINNKIILIEAAQLFETCNIDEAVKHIYRTFRFRKNKVNEKQYYSHIKLANIINAKSYILFHKIKNGKLMEEDCCLILENNENFINMLKDIKYINNELNFISKYKDYLDKNLIKFPSIKDAYNYLLNKNC